MIGKLIQGPLLILKPKEKWTGAPFLWIFCPFGFPLFQVHSGYDGYGFLKEEDI